jgi:hypothetical protein
MVRLFNIDYRKKVSNNYLFEDHENSLIHVFAISNLQTHLIFQEHLARELVLIKFKVRIIYYILIHAPCKDLKTKFE